MREPIGGDTACSGNNYVMETEDKQISKVSMSVYETLQHEQLEIRNGLSQSPVDEDKGKSFEFDPTQGQEETNTQQLEQSGIDHTGLSGASTGGDKPWRKRIHGGSYENVLSPDVRQLLLLTY